MKKRHAATKGGIATSTLIGLGVSCMAALVALSVISAMILGEILKPEHLDVCVPCIHFIAAFLGGLIIGSVSNEKVLYAGAVMLAVLYFVCAGITVLIFDGQFSGVIANVILGVIGMLCSVLIHLRRSSTGKLRIRKRKIC